MVVFVSSIGLVPLSGKSTTSVVPSSFVNLVKEGANCELRLDTFSDTEAH